MVSNRYIPKYKPCPKQDCKGIAVLEDKAHRFLNTGEPYMLRKCPNCEGTWLIVV